MDAALAARLPLEVLDRIRDVDQVAVDAGIFEAAIEEVAGGTDERVAKAVLGVAGLLGSGRTELARAVTGLDKLDEGFIKADSEFAGRGVNAWKGLGFQLIVAAPFDKVTALEPHVERMLQVTKHPTSGHARIDDLATP